MWHNDLLQSTKTSGHLCSLYHNIYEPLHPFHLRCSPPSQSYDFKLPSVSNRGAEKNYSDYSESELRIEFAVHFRLAVEFGIGTECESRCPAMTLVAVGEPLTPDLFLQLLAESECIVEFGILQRGSVGLNGVGGWGIRVKR